MSGKLIIVMANTDPRNGEELGAPAGALVVKKDPLEYLKKLRFHRAVTNASEYGLIS